LIHFYKSLEFQNSHQRMYQFLRQVSWSLMGKLVRPPTCLAAGAGLASLVSYQVEADLGKPGNSLKLENVGEKWSHKYLLQQSSVLSVESASVTLTQTVVAIQTCSKSYCSHMTQLTGLLTMASDGLPLAYTSEEMYDKVVELKGILKKEKVTLIELEVLFTYIRKLMDSVAETAFLVGAEYASLQAASRLSSAEMQVKEDLGMAQVVEQELLTVERENVVKVGKVENEGSKINTDFVKEEVKKLDKMENFESINTEEVTVSVIESEITNDEKQKVEPFSFNSNSDELITISVRDDEENDIKITVKEEEEELKSEENEEDIKPDYYKAYKMPTF